MAYEIKDFQHGRDNSTAREIFINAAAQAILNRLQQTNLESVYTYLYAASCPQLTDKTSPELYQYLVKACNLLGLKKYPRIFVTRNYREMVSVRGMSEPFIIFSSEYLKKLDGETLFGILAGQVAAIRCEHHKIIYITWALEFASSFLPGGSLVVAPLINNWKRCRFFTYDRAFALATKNRALTLRQILLNVVPKNILDKMALGSNYDAFAAQVNHFMSEMSNAKTGIRSAVEMFSEKDFLPVRYSEVIKFFDTRRL